MLNSNKIKRKVYYLCSLNLMKKKKRASNKYQIYMTIIIIIIIIVVVYLIPLFFSIILVIFYYYRIVDLVSELFIWIATIFSSVSYKLCIFIIYLCNCIVVNMSFNYRNRIEWVTESFIAIIIVYIFLF